MSKSNRIIKESIIKLFSQNLEWVKEYPSISFKPDFSNGYICPLCFEVFFQKDLDTTLENHLTLEDIPPKSLGGNPKLLTCKKCNSRSGHELDAHLLNNLLELDSNLFLANSKTKATFELNGNKMNGVIEIEDNGTIKLVCQPNRSNPQESGQFMRDLIPPRTISNSLFSHDKIIENGFKTPPFNIKFHKASNERRAKVALLRIAYLIAYSTLGNSLYANKGLYKVREQILNPDKNILPEVFWINYDFPKELEGVNIICLPKELQSFLIVFNLYTKSKARQFAIVLPGPSGPGIKVYDFIENDLCVGDGSSFLNVVLEHIPKGDFLKYKKFAFAGNWYWQEYTKEEYKPRL
jgi:hypothetical protein